MTTVVYDQPPETASASLGISIERVRDGEGWCKVLHGASAVLAWLHTQQSADTETGVDERCASRNRITLRALPVEDW